MAKTYYKRKVTEACDEALEILEEAMISATRPRPSLWVRIARRLGLRAKPPEIVYGLQPGDKLYDDDDPWPEVPPWE